MWVAIWRSLSLVRGQGSICFKKHTHTYVHTTAQIQLMFPKETQKKRCKESHEKCWWELRQRPAWMNLIGYPFLHDNYMKLNMQTRACCRLASFHSEGVGVGHCWCRSSLTSTCKSTLKKFVEKQSPIAPILLLPLRRVVAVVVQFSQENKSTLTYILSYKRVWFLFQFCDK
jgi:hypothetical protein